MSVTDDSQKSGQSEAAQLPTSYGSSKSRLTMDEFRARLAVAQGKTFWRSLEELAQTPEFLAAARQEFPRLGNILTANASSSAAKKSVNGTETSPEVNAPTHPVEVSLSRRAFLTVMGASLALAGLSGCGVRQPQENIVPYIDQPDGLEPGKPLFFATAMPLNGVGQGVLVTSREGRPIKIEGNPTHPSSMGATDAFAQASLLSLYDPDRSQAAVHRGVPATWDEFVNAATEQMQAMRVTDGKGLRFLTGSITSPTLIAQMQALLARFPGAHWCQYEAIGRENSREGAHLAFGTDINTVYHFDKASVIVSLEGDFLLTMSGHVRYALDFGQRRTARKDKVVLNRLYVAESAPSITGAVAEHRLRVRPGNIQEIAHALAEEISRGAATLAPETGSDTKSEANQNGSPLKRASSLNTDTPDWIRAAVRDLQANRGRSVIVVGESQPPVVHALAHAMNQALGNIGETVEYTEPIEANAGAQSQSFPQLVAEMQAGQIQMLVMLECNPAYTAPADLPFAAALQKIPFSVHLGEYVDETANLSIWHLPQSHYLEAWSDIRGHDGTITVQQPLIAPLYETRTTHEILSVLSGDLDRSDHDVVRDHWQRVYGKEDFDLYWRSLLNDGVVPGTAATPKSVTLLPTVAGGNSIPANGQPESRDKGTGLSAGLDIVFTPDPTIWDGRFSNNGWLQELPKPVTKLTWDNAACLSPRTAHNLKLEDGDNVLLRYRGRQLETPILIVPGHAEDVVSLSLGYGRTQAGNVGTGAGVNAYALRPSDAPWFGTDVELVKTGRRTELAITHSHHSMEGRDIVRSASITEFRRSPGFVHAHQTEPERPESLYPDYEYPTYAWAMSIDLTRCIGCNACIVACQAENNIAVVGKDQVLKGREMHWLRIDRYYEGNDIDHPDATYYMPIPCMHCEKAPCELVCPPGATVHNSDGLNQMVYNRCIGTRYCSNNCPYKVRRFNFLQYADLSPLKQLMRNPEVTVRSRGVMEKCTYCVQRIENAKIQADKENRLVHDGEFTTACAQVCPTNTIVFGNLADPDSAVSRLKREPHDYGLLSELDTRPRTTYLGRVSNPAE